jgi:acyl-[acyl carrier protein]--UDP-N-acetylglucosamine O-acyltransferase
VARPGRDHDGRDRRRRGRLHARPRARPRIHPTAVVARAAELADGVRVGPGATIGPYVRIGGGSFVGANAMVTGRTTLGRNVRIFPVRGRGHAAAGPQVP